MPGPLLRIGTAQLLPVPPHGESFAPTDTWDKSRPLPVWGMLNTALGETEPSPLKEAAKPIGGQGRG